MFGLFTQTPQFFSDLADEVRLFEEVKRIEKLEREDTPGEKVLRHFFLRCGAEWQSRAVYLADGAVRAEIEMRAAVPDTGDGILIKKMQKRLVKQTVYGVLKAATGKELPWGSLTGIRPTKLFRELQKDIGTEAARELFLRGFDVSDVKTDLAQRIAENQRPFLEDVREGDIDVYVGIPFCTSRCKYCSFVSRDMERSGDRKEAYLARLTHEIMAAEELIAGRRVRALYVGGGTPTALSEKELDALLTMLHRVFGTPAEYTVEAGRPDTVTKEKLEIIRAHGAGRVSINPQTLKRQTLDLIGRKHSVRDFYDAFALARRAGFSSVNTDIILGLPGEGLDDVERTVSGIIGLAPENITAHTLAIKNSSEFALEQTRAQNAALTGRMVDAADEMLLRAGYEPYYLYRQKYMSGNLENAGFAKGGALCRYNIDHMEETVSILAFGAGAISKRLFGGGARIERAANVKDIKQYIERTDEMVGRKKKLFGEV
ncbi:MAG TPA: coproporphyrinogen dehydrogenase HemZ [Clostridiales bacterium]|nr:coproporphyrinogen dehydrogenase HemZ [Clostridiales bacterium]